MYEIESFLLESFELSDERVDLFYQIVHQNSGGDETRKVSLEVFSFFLFDDRTY